MAGLDPREGAGLVPPNLKIYSEMELNSKIISLFLLQKCLNVNSSGHQETQIGIFPNAVVSLKS